MYQAQTLAPGAAVEIYEVATFFRILAAPLSDLTVRFYRHGAEVSEVRNIGAGYAERFEQAFDRVRIESAAGGVVAYVTKSGGDVRYDTPPNGNVTITNASGAVADSEKTVTNASAELLAVKPGRRYLLIQNKDAAGAVYVTFGALAVVGQGIKIAPGGSYSADGGFCPANAIQAVGDLASNPNICVVEG